MTVSFFFQDARFSLSVFGRIVVRVLSALWYIVLAGACFTFLAADLRNLQALGGLLGIFLLDRIFHWREGDVPLPELRDGVSANSARSMRPETLRAFERAYERSVVRGTDATLELVRVLLAHSRVREVLVRLDTPADAFEQKVDALLGSTPAASIATLEQVAIRAGELALSRGDLFIDSTVVFAALAHVTHEPIQRLLEAFALSAPDLSLALVFAGLEGSFRSRGSVRIGEHRGKQHRIMNRAWTARPTPTLDQYARDLTDRARMGEVGFLVGHAAEYARLRETLARPMNPNVLLVGEQGVGRETLVEHLALDILHDRVPAPLFDRRLVSLDIASLVAGANAEELQARLQRAVAEIERAGNIILHIPDIHNLVRTSGTAYLSAADALIPILKNNLFPVIGTTYPREFKQLIEPRSDFSQIFETVSVAEISEADAGRLLAYDAVILERQHRITISLGAISTAVHLAHKYFNVKPLPGSAEEILKSATSYVLERGGRVVGRDEVVSVVEEKINVPIRETSEAESEKLLNLESIIHERFVDQEEAVKAVSQSLRAYRAGLTRTGGPIAAFLFVGPTGVGKTELAKIIAGIQFGSDGAMVRFDMTEYQDTDSIARFIGSPDGAVSGALTDAVIAKPFSLILLDEFEKAHPDILNLFLQVFDDGRLTNNAGRTVDFQNTIIIATSNAHSDLIIEAIRAGRAVSDIAEDFKKRLVDVFKPELLNRFTKIVVFRNLELPEVERVAAFNLAALGKSLTEQGIEFSADASAVALVAKLGYDPSFGARPLRRVIDERVRAMLAEKILKKEIGRGSRIRLVARGEDFDYETAAER